MYVYRCKRIILHFTYISVYIPNLVLIPKDLMSNDKYLGDALQKCTYLGSKEKNI